MVRCGIFILTQNTVERKIYLKTTLYFLFKNFNKKYNYPIIILHEGDYDSRSQEEITKSIRENHRHLLTFKEIAKEHFSLPQHIDIDKVTKTIELQPVPYWRNLKYRLMCNFWVRHFFKYTEDFDYVMRLDDDSIIEEPLAEDLFKMMHAKDLVYLSNIVHIDCGLCNFGMKELFEKLLEDKPLAKSKLNSGVFVQAKLKEGDANDRHFQQFKKVYALVNDVPVSDVPSEFITNMPLMYYNNFFITATAFWKRPDVQQIIDGIDKHGGIFYYRYGDAPIHTLITSLLEPEKVSRAIFKYSKRLQREAFIDSEKNIHSYMPKSYDKTSCITDK